MLSVIVQVFGPLFVIKSEKIACFLVVLLTFALADNKMDTNVITAPHAAHPKYIDMVVEAIMSLNDRRGTSKQAISKYISGCYGVSGSHVITFNSLRALVTILFFSVRCLEEELAFCVGARYAGES